MANKECVRLLENDEGYVIRNESDSIMARDIYGFNLTPFKIRGPIEGHYVVCNKFIAHSKLEARDKAYKLALDHAKKFAKKMQIDLSDETSRAKEGKLASAVGKGTAS